MLVRFLQDVRAVCDRLDPVHRAIQLFHASIAEPDKLGTKDAAVKDDIARFLMRQKNVLLLTWQRVFETRVSPSCFGGMRLRHWSLSVEDACMQ
jgi:hypothetical protein